MVFLTRSILRKGIELFLQKGLGEIISTGEKNAVN